ncbi:hypothetical protein STRAU_5239 [Streptomyces aurantiacus JA 4570]|uniref:Uncharacterized protein n=1 Tax=Streptomyces aurantiacus JA 4570 TaxID=1286094 RepID=S4AJP7_9ACTN|nr:hypothetical protein STRAU_5239 [Streptomyces aurantiacus JA 4570]
MLPLRLGDAVGPAAPGALYPTVPCLAPRSGPPWRGSLPRGPYPRDGRMVLRCPGRGQQVVSSGTPAGLREPRRCSSSGWR